MSIESKFYAVPDESRIPSGKKDKVMTEVDRLQGTLERLFPMPCKYGACGVGEYSGVTIMDRLIDTEETRIGKAPTDKAKEQLTGVANRAVENNNPLALVGIYGTPRSLDRPELNVAQLADLSAIMMVQAAMDRIHSAHSPGVSYRAVDEDLTALWLDIAQHPLGKEGGEKFKSIYSKYYKDRKRLIDLLEQKGLINVGKTKIELLSESDLYKGSLEKKGDSMSAEESFLGKCETVRPHILNYLTASGEIMDKLYGEDDKQWVSAEDDPQLWSRYQLLISETKECKDLLNTGWQGLIPPEMRKYYLEKFRCILGGADLRASDPKLLFHVATYLSSTLVKFQAGTLTEGIPAGTPVIRVPLVRPVDGRPSSHQSLVPLRTLPKVKGDMDKRVSHSNRAAWLSVAVQGNKKLRLVDTAEYAELPEELVVPVQIYMVAPDNGAGSYLVDTAIMLSDS
ncbi:MAG: hypothetical protein IPJ68_01575 [Candidatus Moraniibacteriota bacterium]|nr:MAG: hypothetical protein IPJ68_01575 [Candidatus Moranbacteria bacterium]